jgi:TPR repeat protein
MKKYVIAILLFVCLALVACTSEFDKGRQAYGRGDFAGAMNAWKPLAEKGDRAAQYAVADLYFNGKGVPQDQVEGLKWLRISANQGNPVASLDLGEMYFNGVGVEKDPVKAAMWMTLAAGKADGSLRTKAQQSLQSLKNVLTPDQMSQAQKLASEWKPGQS